MEIKVARPYAKAAFEAACSAGTLPAWQDALDLLAQAVEASKVQGWLENPTVSPEVFARWLLALKPELFDETRKRFVEVLAQKRRLLVLPAIKMLFETYRSQADRLRQVELTAAYPIAPEQKARIEQALAKHFGEAVALKMHVDPSLLGGLRIRAGDEVIDASVVGRLAKVASALGV